MKICWDNLSVIEYRPHKDNWIDRCKNIRYCYVEECNTCGKPFLGHVGAKNLYCSAECNATCYKCGPRPELRGENSPAWNPDKTDEERVVGRQYPEYSEWRLLVYERDGFTCQVCGQVRGDINAHHLEAYNNAPELRTTLSNGITLCETCHKDFHHCYGRGNNTRAQFEEWLGRKV